MRFAQLPFSQSLNSVMIYMNSGSSLFQQNLTIMKRTLTILTLSITSFVSFAQDTIRKTDGAVIIALIQEINEESVIYKRHDQADGPIRKISVAQISRITYKDGTSERFTIAAAHPTANEIAERTVRPSAIPGTINNTNETIIIHRKGPDLRIAPGERIPGENEVNDNILRNGAYIDGLIGFAVTSKEKNMYSNYGGSPISTRTQYANVTFGMRFGSKMYFGQNEKRKFGLNMAWVSLTGLLNDANRGDIILAPVHIGLASAYKFSEHTGLEVNTSMGMVMSSLYQGTVGIKYGADIKFRYDALAVGIDLSRTNSVFGSGREYGNLAAISIGIKF